MAWTDSSENIRNVSILYSTCFYTLYHFWSKEERTLIKWGMDLSKDVFLKVNPNKLSWTKDDVF